MLRDLKKNLSTKILFSNIRILLYHRICDKVNDPQLLCVSPKNFEEHLNIIKKRFNVLKINDLQKKNSYNHPNNSIIITFDDGYADNYYFAKKSLENYEIPASIFVVTGKIGSEEEFWWDELARIFLTSSHLPKKLGLFIKGKYIEWEIEENINFFLKKKLEFWNIFQPVFTKRQKVYLELTKILKSINNNERSVLISTLLEWANLPKKGRKDFLPLTEDELKNLVQGGLITIGSHTHSHELMSILEIKDQEIELLESKNTLEKIINYPINNFSYPFGDRTSYSPDTKKILRKLGFCSGLANYPGRVNIFTPKFEIPRFIIRDWDGEKFSNFLTEI